MTLLSLLAVAGNAETVKLMQPLLCDDEHFVRWGAAQAIASLDPMMGESAVKQLANDPHLEVRAAARDALETWAGGVGRVAAA